MAGGFDLRSALNGIDEAPGKTWFWELEAGVIDAGRCVECGICVAACPSDSIGIGAESGLPELVKMCTGCSLCWDFCPRGGLRYETLWPEPLPSGPDPDGEWMITGGRGDGLGRVEESYAARVSERIDGAQDGGVVSAILVAALEAGEIDGVLLARQSETETWKGVPYLARTADEVRACAGSFYNQTMALAHLDLGDADLPPEPRLALVGTPCEVQGIRAMQAMPWSRGASKVDAVVLTIALLCTKSFDYERLMLRELRDRRGLDLTQVGKVDVIHGKMIVEDRHGETVVSEPVKDFHGAALKGCDECADFLGRAADLSVGSVGSDAGWSSVLVRTPAGAKALARAASSLDVGDLPNPGALVKLDSYDRKVALRTLRRTFDPDGPMFISYEEHVDGYADSDRAPAAADR